MKWLAQLGDVGYTFLLWLNRIYNVYRARHGQPYYSLSQAIKQKVKSAVSYISDFEEELVKFARTRKCDGIICGHGQTSPVPPQNRKYKKQRILLFV